MFYIDIMANLGFLINFIVYQFMFNKREFTLFFFHKACVRLIKVTLNYMFVYKVEKITSK